MSFRPSISPCAPTFVFFGCTVVLHAPRCLALEELLAGPHGDPPGARACTNRWSADGGITQCWQGTHAEHGGSVTLPVPHLHRLSFARCPCLYPPRQAYAPPNRHGSALFVSPCLASPIQQAWQCANPTFPIPLCPHFPSPFKQAQQCSSCQCLACACSRTIPHPH